VKNDFSLLNLVRELNYGYVLAVLPAIRNIWRHWADPAPNFRIADLPLITILRHSSDDLIHLDDNSASRLSWRHSRAVNSEQRGGIR